MIPKTMVKYIVNEIGAPRVITSNEQFDKYVASLLEFDKQSKLTDAEKNFGQLLIMLIEAYIEKNHSIRSASFVGCLEEMLSADDFWRNN
jgi:hypothetical protein